MTYNNLKWVEKYDKIVNQGQRPLILTNDECYDIHPEAVKELLFQPEGISFRATFNGVERFISVFKDDINALVQTQG